MKTRIFLPRLLALMCWGFSSVNGMYMKVDTAQVPVQRLIKNLSAKHEASPKDAELCHQLARAHSVAYARKLGENDGVTTKKTDTDRLWFGYEPAFVPFAKTEKTEDAQRQKEALQHLQQAIQYYQKAHQLKPDDFVILLGLSWCQEQSGDKQAALAGYRKVLEHAWITEKAGGGTMGPILHVETSGYALPLLDQTKDAEEIKRIQQRNEELEALPRAITPLIVPLHGQVARLESLVDEKARVRFDLDGSGRMREWPWITPQAGWLVYDPVQSGEIRSAIQMFGNRSFLLFHRNGYEALSLLDDNADGSIAGDELKGLALWCDANGNGISETGEVKTLASHGIRALATSSQSHASGIPWSESGVTFCDGSTSPTYDVIFTSH